MRLRAIVRARAMQPMLVMKDPIRGNTVTWPYEDGPTKGKAFEHTFASDGTVSYRMADSEKITKETSYAVARNNENVFAVSYLGSAGR